MYLLTGLYLTLFSRLVLAATKDEWRSRAIYQVMTDRFARTDGSTTATCDTGDQVYCGGSFQGIIDHLDYIQGMGFTAIWISPVTYQLQEDTVDGEAYHGYWQQDLYQINSNFGTAADLQSLASELHDRDMYLMVDVVVNHNGWAGAASTVDYSQFNPFNQESDYHPYCAIDYTNATSTEVCWGGDSNVELVDLDTESETVMSGYQTWISQLVSNYSIDGLRIDTALEVDNAFWSGFASAAGVFITGEYDNDDVTVVCDGQNYMDSVLNYAVYWPLFSAFSSTSGDISALADMISSVKSDCADSTVLGSFSENHDQDRFASVTSDMSLAENIISYTMLADGIPIIYEGQEQHYSATGGSGVPYNREAIWFSDYNTDATLYSLIKTLNTIRSYAISADSDYLTYKNYVIYSDTSTIAMRKGYNDTQVITVLSNLGADGSSYTLDLGNSGWESSTEVMELLTCTSATVADDGTIPVPMASGLPRIYSDKTGACDSVCSC